MPPLWSDSYSPSFLSLFHWFFFSFGKHLTMFLFMFVNGYDYLSCIKRKIIHNSCSDIFFFYIILCYQCTHWYFGLKAVHCLLTDLMVKKIAYPTHAPIFVSSLKRSHEMTLSPELERRVKALQKRFFSFSPFILQ